MPEKTHMFNFVNDSKGSLHLKYMIVVGHQCKCDDRYYCAYGLIKGK